MAEIPCMNCPATYARPEGAKGSEVDAARVKGWAVWEGMTLGGQHVKRVYCPVCRGVAEPPPEPAPSWDAVCKTCDSSMSEEEGDEKAGPFTEKDAKHWRDNHSCEPWVDLIAPPVKGKPADRSVA
jgi:hypothetical protein